MGLSVVCVIYGRFLCDTVVVRVRSPCSGHWGARRSVGYLCATVSCVFRI